MAKRNVADPAADAGRVLVLFCPFCREAYESETHCPTHELPLVSWFELRNPDETGLDSVAPVAWYSPRLGRGWIASGAVLVLGAFLVGSIASVDQHANASGRMLDLAVRSAPRLWLVPAAALTQLSILLRRRSWPELRGARLAVWVLAVVPACVTAWTWRGIDRALTLLASRTGETLTHQLGMGAYVIACGTAAMAIGAARLGARRPAA